VSLQTLARPGCTSRGRRGEGRPGALAHAAPELPRPDPHLRGPWLAERGHTRRLRGGLQERRRRRRRAGVDRVAAGTPGRRAGGERGPAAAGEWLRLGFGE
jgi:hypothetical protein